MLLGDVNAAFSVCDYTESGEVGMGGQEHFYFETQCCSAIPSGLKDISHFKVY